MRLSTVGINRDGNSDASTLRDASLFFRHEDHEKKIGNLQIVYCYMEKPVYNGPVDPIFLLETAVADMPHNMHKR